MTRHVALPLGAWLAACAAVALAALGWVGGGGVDAARPPVPPGGAVEAPRPEPLEARASVLAARNPFRLHRTPAALAFGAEPEPETMAPEPPRPTVRPVLAGLVGGPPWSALVEGLPGRAQGVVMSPGDSLQGLTFREVRGDTVVLVSADTTWLLTPKRPWR